MLSKPILAGLALMLPLAVAAQSSTSGQRTGAITTAVPFLTISPDARAGALGDAGVANSYDANATHWNPAALAFAQNRVGVDLSYAPWLRALGIPDINLAYLAGYYNLGQKGGVAGLSLRYFSLGNIQFTDENGIETGQFNANEFALGGHYAHVITDKLSVGGSLRLVYSNLVGASSGISGIEPGVSGAGDLAMLYRTGFDFGRNGGTPMVFSVGLNLSNIGAKMGYNTQNNAQRDFLPTTFRLGYALEVEIDDFNKVVFLNDFSKLMVPSEGGQSEEPVLSGMFSSFGDAPGGFSEEMEEIMVSLGAEYWYNNLFAVRAGYFHEAENKGNRKYLTLGAALKFKMFSIDFAYLVPFVQNHPLQNTLRFTLGLDIGEMDN